MRFFWGYRSVTPPPGPSLSTSSKVMHDQRKMYDVCRSPTPPHGVFLLPLNHGQSKYDRLIFFSSSPSSSAIAFVPSNILSTDDKPSPQQSTTSENTLSALSQWRWVCNRTDRDAE